MKDCSVIFAGILFLFFGFANAKAGVSTDSLSTRTLQEYVVEGKNAWIDGNKAVFIPSKKDRKLSNSIGTLLERIDLPMLNVNGEIITNLKGNQIPVFINGVRADNLDNSVFWPKLAQRVEYIDHPTDPVFGGAECIINIVMKKLDTGGIGKLNANQQIRNSGNYSGAGKLERGNMTYALNARHKYSRNHFTESVENTTFSDFNYNGNYIEDLTENNKVRDILRNNTTGLAMNARYSKGTTTVTHGAALQWIRTPGKETVGISEWTPGIFQSGFNHTRINKRGFSPQLNGSYIFALASAWSLVANWTYAYGHNGTDYSYLQEGVNPVDNRNKENVNQAALTATVQWNKSQRFVTWLTVSGQNNWHKISYSGDLAYASKQQRGETGASLNLWFGLSPYFALTASPGIAYSIWKSNGIGENELSPKGTLSLGWYPGSKITLTANVDYARYSPASSETSTVVIRQTEILWIKGNPYLKNLQDWNASLMLNWMPHNNVSFLMNAVWGRKINEVINGYLPMENLNGGIMRHYINSNPMNTYSLDGVLSMKLIGRKLRVNIQPTYRHYDPMNSQLHSLGWMRMRGSVGGDIGNCNLSVGYGGAEKFLSSGGRTVTKTSDSWFLNFTYGTGDLYVNARIENIFRTKAKGWSSTDQSHYCNMSEWISNGRYLRVNLTYTFGFGKKTNRNISVKEAIGVDSGSINIEREEKTDN